MIILWFVHTYFQCYIVSAIRSLGVLLGCCSCFCSCSFVFLFIRFFEVRAAVVVLAACVSHVHLLFCFAAVVAAVALVVLVVHLIILRGCCYCLLSRCMNVCCRCCFAVVCSFAGWLVLLGC